MKRTLTLISRAAPAVNRLGLELALRTRLHAGHPHIARTRAGEGYIAAAIQWIEATHGVALAKGEYRLLIEEPPALLQAIMMGVGPLVSIQAIEADHGRGLAALGAWKVPGEDCGHLHLNHVWINRLKGSLGAAKAFRVDFTAGFSEVPHTALLAVAALCREWNEHPELAGQSAGRSAAMIEQYLDLWRPSRKGGG